MVDTKLKSHLEEYLSERLASNVNITRLDLLAGGGHQANYAVDLKVAEGKERGDYELVMRTDRGASIYSSIRPVDEYFVIEAAHNNGVNTPRPYWPVEDRDVIGTTFYFMERIAGNAQARFILKDRSLKEYRPHMASELAESMARIHDVTPDKAELPFLIKPDIANESVAEMSVREIRQRLDNIEEGQPAKELALSWLKQNAPKGDGLVLVHGDFRTGNFLVSAEGLHGIIDWEFAHWGDRYEDIAWLCLRDWRFGQIHKPVGGFADRDEFYLAYEKASGVEIDPRTVLYWEVMGNLRWSIGAMEQSQRHLSGKVKGIEIAAVGKRGREMEYEMLDIIEKLEAGHAM